MRNLIATTSLDCGVNTFGVKYVSHFGPVFELVDISQQICRTGRDGKYQCHAILNTNSGGKSKNRKNVKAKCKSKIMKRADQLFLVLFKLRVGLSNYDLAYRFGDTIVTVTKIKRYWLPARVIQLIKPEKMDLRRCLLKRFKHAYSYIMHY